MPFPNDKTATETMMRFFARKRIPYTEESLINVLEDDTSAKTAVYFAVIALRDVGTTRSIPALKKKLHYPMRDVKDCSILTIAHIAEASETLFYADALRDKRTQKVYPMWAILDAADDRAIDAVLEYVTSVLKKLARGRLADLGDAYPDGLKFLAKYVADDPRIDGVLRGFICHWDKLSPGYRESLKERSPFFSKHAPN